MNELPKRLDFEKPEHGKYAFGALLRECYAKAAEYRRLRGEPEPDGTTFLGYPIVITHGLPKETDDE